MSRTNIDLDDEAVDLVMKQQGFRTKREAVNYALREVAIVPMTVDEALAMRGSGWDGDLDAMRTARVFE